MDTNRPVTETYSLTDLFGGDMTLVIPDMQRDYCWGTDNATPSQTFEKVTTFVGNLAYMYVKDQPGTLGLLYTYQYPPQSGRMSIIDGQQRITTLYLLLGMLYRRVPSDWLRQLLISDYELSDDREPKLIYEGRREVLYFLSDLVSHFFLNRDGRLSQLESSKWFFNSYNSDPNAVNLIKAIRCIDSVLENMAATIPDWDFGKFTRFIATQLRFVMCVLPTRAQAESMFITINTTGEPLTTPQNLRSLLFAVEDDSVSPEAKHDAALKFNEMEDWFWIHRDTSQEIDCACDASMERFLHVFRCWDAEQEEMLSAANLDLNRSNISNQAQQAFERLYSFFEKYRRLCIALGSCADIVVKAALPTEAELMSILPSIEYINRFGNKVSDSQISAIWHFFANITRYQRPAASGLDTQMAVQTVRLMPNHDLTSLLQIHRPSKRIINDEALSALRLLAQHPNQRARAEHLLDKAQRHPLLNGRTECIIAWSTPKASDIADLDKLEGYIDDIYAIFGTDIDKQPALDIVRRALLTIQHPDYPIARRADSVMSLCWNDYDWQRLLTIAPGLVRQLIDRQRQLSFQQLIDRFDDKSYPYYFLIKDARMMSRASRRQLLCPCKAFVGLTAADDNAAVQIWHVQQLMLQIDTSQWMSIRAYGSRCLYSDHLTYNLALDLYYQPEERSPFRLEVFSRRDVDKGRRLPINIKPLIAAAALPFRLDRRRNRFYTYLPDAAAAVDAFRKISTLSTTAESYTR